MMNIYIEELCKLNLIYDIYLNVKILLNISIEYWQNYIIISSKYFY